MSPRAVLAGGLAIVLAAMVIVMSVEEPRMAASNLVPELGFLPELPGGERLCQAEELVPGDTDRLRLLAGTFGRPGGELDVTLRSGGRELTGGQLEAGHGQGHLVVPLDRVERTTGHVTLCIENRGVTPVAFAGSDRTSSNAKIDGVEVPSRVRVEYYRPGRESWWSLIASVVHRFGYGKAGLLGSWTMVAALLLTLCACGIGAAALVRSRP